MMKLSIQINGMHCESCVRAVEEQIDRLRGVQSRHVHVGTVELTVDEAVTPKGEVFAAIRRAGAFDVSGFAATPA